MLSAVGESLVQHDISDFPWLDNPFDRIEQGESPIHHGLIGVFLIATGVVLSFALPYLYSLYGQQLQQQPQMQYQYNPFERRK
jgi:hypothetical protein